MGDGLRACGHTIFPRVDPAVIMAVRRAAPPRATGDGPRKAVDLAGFVEAEPLGVAVAREVLEETGVVVDDVAPRHLPAVARFPRSLMLAFEGAPAPARKREGRRRGARFHLILSREEFSGALASGRIVPT